METGETKRSPGYGKPPWVFRGSALYQLHLVRAETARALIPKEFRLVEAFGYTLGGFFLASYEDSPAGVFDELVVIAGTVWNPPTSCAWAAKVLVNSDEACRHGRKDVGLPSQVARFSKRRSPAPLQPFERQNRFLDILGIGTSYPPDRVEVSVSDPTAADPCHLSLAISERVGKWKGPPVKMWLPSFSGRTDHNPSLLKYSCQIECRVRAVSPVEVKLSPRKGDVEGRQQDNPEDGSYTAMEPARDLGRDPSLSVMLSKPILALKFSCLRMQVEAPVVISHRQETSPGYS